LFIANTGASVLASIFALRKDISRYNEILKGNTPEDDNEVISMRLDRIGSVSE
jgi:hypothetical protein